MSDETAPATKADLGRVEGRVQKADDQILAILGNIEKRLAPKIAEHERRITRLEEVVV